MVTKISRRRQPVETRAAEMSKATKHKRRGKRRSKVPEPGPRMRRERARKRASRPSSDASVMEYLWTTTKGLGLAAQPGQA
ncbi:hypothetical protein PHISCL_11103 [Aspergillus sclerotialis]|uniref:Uncharacterized protein n=1 Tax=Aspergillus sclerotialis TaxID=2070753 RepID=A0A3A2Z1F2_9EURO|nr:hypothetical protein PHISCL_11103 [Aspergillus sclerotialis]